MYNMRITPTKAKRNAAMNISGGELRSVWRTSIACTTTMETVASNVSTSTIMNPNSLREIGITQSCISPWKNVVSTLIGGTCQVVWLEVLYSIASLSE